MSVAIVCASHTPLMYKGPASNETDNVFERRSNGSEPS